MSHSIERAMKEAKQILHRTQDPTNPQRHRAIVCIICDWFIIGTEKIHELSSYQISQHTNRLSVKTYKTYHGVELKNELKKQYQVNDDKLRNLLFAPINPIKEVSQWLCHLCLLLQGNVPKLDKQKNTAQICHSKWFCDWISSNGN